jgi:hypothetical protein
MNGPRRPKRSNKPHISYIKHATHSHSTTLHILPVFTFISSFHKHTKRWLEIHRGNPSKVAKKFHQIHIITARFFLNQLTEWSTGFKSSSRAIDRWSSSSLRSQDPMDVNKQEYIFILIARGVSLDLWTSWKQHIFYTFSLMTYHTIPLCLWFYEAYI